VSLSAFTFADGSVADQVSNRHRVRRVAYGHGEIRLEDEEGGKCACGGTLSVRSDPGEGEVMSEDEKVSSEVLG
jgi:hypothetical protein